MENRLLIYHLLQHQHLVIPGIGTIFLQRNPAENNNGLITPPNNKIVWNSSKSKAEEYFNQHSDFYLIPEVEQFYKTLHQVLENKNEVEIYGIGTIRKNLNIYSFEEHYSLHYNLYFPSKLPLKSASTKNKIANISPTETEEFQYRNSITSASIMAIAAFVILMVGSLFAWSNDQLINQIQTVVQDTIRNVIYVDVKPDISDTLENIDNAENVNPEEYCTIVTGSFKKLSYLESMYQVLEKDFPEFEIVKNINSEFTRIGLRVPCEDEDIINTIKDKITQDAWFLYLAPIQ